MIKQLEERLLTIYRYLPSIKKDKEYINGHELDKYKIFGYTIYADTLEDEFKEFIISYLLYIDKSRIVDWLKFGFIKDYFPLEDEQILQTKSDISEYIKRRKVFGNGFSKTTPYIFLAFIKFNNKSYYKSNSKKFIACELYDLYRDIGKAYMECDGKDIQMEALNRYLSYLDMLENELKSKLNNDIYEDYKNHILR